MRTAAAIVALGVLIALAAGIGSYAFINAKGYSYLGHDPAACANCHVMSDYYAAWVEGPHRSVAGCNDCHTPHRLIPKYAVKASNGFWHSFYFTTGRYPDHLEIKPRNRRVTQQACLRCHSEMTEAIGQPAQLDAARKYQRKAQFLLDFGELDRLPRGPGVSAAAGAVGRLLAARGTGVAGREPGALRASPTRDTVVAGRPGIIVGTC